ncbi:MAG: hypothetical protein M1831_007282 [Alyxoria varia]|nr:MAG: hypothetical protein M1831_007282 [Alyxoria varia]
MCTQDIPPPPAIPPTVHFPTFTPPHTTSTTTNEKPNLIHGLHPSELSLLRSHTLHAKSRAYCPYSHFRVGATLIITSNTYVSGANIENAAYPCGTCAERVALGTAIASSNLNSSAAEGEDVGSGGGIEGGVGREGAQGTGGTQGSESAQSTEGTQGSESAREAVGGRGSESEVPKFRALGVGTDLEADEDDNGKDDGKGFGSPCGMCRQVLREFCALDMPIFMFDRNGKYVVRTLGQPAFDRSVD